MVELVDTTDLKSVDPKGRAGSSPAPGTKREIAAMRSPVFFVHSKHGSKPSLAVAKSAEQKKRPEAAFLKSWLEDQSSMTSTENASP